MDSVFNESITAPATQQSADLLSIIYLCDCSGSMAGSRIAAVNTALAKVFSELTEFSKLSPQLNLQLGILRFANSASWHIPPAPIGEVAWSPLVDTSGVTALGAAYRLLANYLTNLEVQVAELLDSKHLPPILILFSDGMPTDDVVPALKALSAHPLAQQALRFAIGIGHEVDTSVLEDWVQESHPAKAELASMPISVTGSAVELREVVSSFTLSAAQKMLADATL